MSRSAKRTAGDAIARRRTRPIDARAAFQEPFEPDSSDHLLGQIALERRTQPFMKPWHYLAFYDRVLGDLARRSRDGELTRPLRLLEIGVLGGGSLDLWRQFLGDEAVIFGVDVDVACSLITAGGQIRIGSQADRDFMQSVVAEMGGVDVVIDDGSHQVDHVITTLRTLFPLLADGGLYVIEDLGTSYLPEYGGGLRRRGSSVEFLKRLVDHVNRDVFATPALSSEDVGLFADLAGVEFAASLALLRKQAQNPLQLLIVGPPES